MLPANFEIFSQEFHSCLESQESYAGSGDTGVIAVPEYWHSVGISYGSLHAGIHIGLYSEQSDFVNTVIGGHVVFDNMDDKMVVCVSLLYIGGLFVPGGGKEKRKTWKKKAASGLWHIASGAICQCAGVCVVYVFGPDFGSDCGAGLCECICASVDYIYLPLDGAFILDSGDSGPCSTY